MPSADGNGWFAICTAQSPEVAGEIIRILLSNGAGSPGILKVQMIAL